MEAVAQRIRGFGRATEELVEEGLSNVVLGIGMTAFWVVGPVLIVGHMGIRGIQGYGDFRNQQAFLDGGNQSARKKFNGLVRDLGNRISAPIKRKLNYGFGDLLTENVNFRKAGAVVGAAAPLATWSGANICQEGPSGVVHATIPAAILMPFTVTSTILGGVAGYAAGDKIDRFLGDDSLRYIGKQGWNV